MNIIGINPPGPYPSLPTSTPSETAIPPSSLTPGYTKFKGKIQNIVLKSFRRPFGGLKHLFFKNFIVFKILILTFSQLNFLLILKKIKLIKILKKLNNNEYFLNLKSTIYYTYFYSSKKKWYCYFYL